MVVGPLLRGVGIGLVAGRLLAGFLIGLGAGVTLSSVVGSLRAKERPGRPVP